MCAGAGTSVSSRFSANFSIIPEGFAIGLPMLDCYPYLNFCFGFFGESRQETGARSSLRSVAGLEDVLDESCGGDVEDDLVPEFDDKPRHKRYEIFRLAANLLPLFGQVWLLTTGPLISISVFFAELSK